MSNKPTNIEIGCTINLGGESTSAPVMEEGEGEGGGGERRGGRGERQIRD